MAEAIRHCGTNDKLFGNPEESNKLGCPPSPSRRASTCSPDLMLGFNAEESIRPPGNGAYALQPVIRVAYFREDGPSPSDR